MTAPRRTSAGRRRGWALGAGVSLAVLALSGCASPAAPDGPVSGAGGVSSSTSPSADEGARETSPAAAAASLPDSCTLLTADDIQAVNRTLGNPTGSGELTVTPTTTGVGPAVDQHSACHYVLGGVGGAQFDLDVMTRAEYESLDDFESPSPVSGLGDEAAVHGVRPAVRVGAVGALIADNQGTTEQGIELLRIVASKL
jgi:hypothetical protein